MATINIVPYVDVMLVLLVIFMVTTPLLTQGVKIDLPKATSQAISDQQKALVVSINKQTLAYGEFNNAAKGSKSSTNPADSCRSIHSLWKGRILDGAITAIGLA